MTEVAIRDDGKVAVQILDGTTLLVPAELVEKYPALSPELDLTELLESALGTGGELRLSDLTRIKVPPKEFTSLQIPDENGELASARDFQAIPVGMASRRSWWPSPDPTGKPPECSSRDLENGQGEFGPGSEQNPSGKCADCPMSQIGSMALIKPVAAGKEPTNASACKEQRLLFVLTDRELLPLMLVVPPGSLPGHKAFSVGLVKRAIMGPVRPDLGLTPAGRPQRASAWLAVEVGFGLEQKTNPAGQTYNILTFKQVRRLSEDEAVVIGQYGRFIDDLIVKQAEALDRVAADVAGNPGGEPVADAPGDVEFDDTGMPVDDVDLSGAGRPRASAAR